MDFVQNFPFFSIILSMFSGTVSSVLPAKAAKWLNTVVIGAVGCMSAVLLVYLMGKGTSYTYMMGHFPAPGEMKSVREFWKRVWPSFSVLSCSFP